MINVLQRQGSKYLQGKDIKLLSEQGGKKMELQMELRLLSLMANSGRTQYFHLKKFF